MPAGKTTGELEVRLAAGIEYISGSVAATGGTIALKAGATNANKPVFTINAAGGATVVVSLKRKGY